MAIQINRKHYKVWESENPVLDSGEKGLAFGYGLNKDRIKVGDGITAWNDLEFQPFSDIISFSTIEELKEYDGRGTYFFIEENSSFYSVVTDIGLLKNDNNVLFSSTVNSNIYLKEISTNASIEDFGAVGYSRDVYDLKTDSFTVAVPELQEGETTALLPITLDTGSTISANSSITFSPNSTGAFALSIDRYVVLGADQLEVEFKNDLKQVFPAGNVTVNIEVKNPVVDVSSGVITAPNGIFTSDDIGKSLEVQDSYLEASTFTDPNYNDFRNPAQLRYNESVITGICRDS